MGRPCQSEAGGLRGQRRERAEKGNEAGWAERGEELGQTGICWAARDERKGSGLGQRDWLLGREKGIRPGLAFPIFLSPFLFLFQTKLNLFEFKFEFEFKPHSIK